MNEDARLLAAAVLCLLATGGIGVYVSRRPLTPLDAASEHLRGHGTRLAVLFTRTGYGSVLTALFVVLGVLELVVRGGILFTLILGATQLLSQSVANLAKEIARRTRPADWLFRREGGYSFPSGHATTAVVFFGGSLAFVWYLPLPPFLHAALTLLVAAFIVGIPWSRMALSAHYATDVLAGMLSGCAWLCLMFAVIRHLHVAKIFG